ncbi:MAG: ATP synthase F1 subunit epsilon [Lachnospiraceae bacterium]|nr:ATP synthase F1 subunit epsilon [Lachnospiraceae bacterium]
MAELFQLQIVSPNRVFYEGEVTMVEMNTSDGEMGVYAKHIPLTTVVAPGLVTIHEESDVKFAAIHSGFAVIMPDKVTIMAEVAEWPDEIDIDRAEESKSRAEKRLAESDPSIDVVRAEMSLRRALTRIEASQK